MDFERESIWRSGTNEDTRAPDHLELPCEIGRTVGMAFRTRFELVSNRFRDEYLETYI